MQRVGQAPLPVQEAELRKVSAVKVYRETASGAAGSRPQLARMLHMPVTTWYWRPGATGWRSTRDLLNILDKISKAGAPYVRSG